MYIYIQYDLYSNKTDIMKLEENHESQSSHMLDILQLLFYFQW